MHVKIICTYSYKHETRVSIYMGLRTCQLVCKFSINLHVYVQIHTNTYNHTTSIFMNMYVHIQKHDE